MELLQELKLSEKLHFIKTFENEIVSDTQEKYRKINDLLFFCKDSEVDVVLKAMRSLCRVFCEVLPTYRIRQDFEKEKEKGVTLSKDVQSLRDLE